jgi:hypothetical protein
MQGELSLAGCDLKSPEVIAILGLRGGVAKWCKDHEITPTESWLKYDRIFGVIDSPSLVYEHRKGTRTTYLSLRSLEGKRHLNIPTALGGPRQPYISSTFTPNATSVVIVEGQADAITLAQWGYGAIALCGTALDQSLKEKLADKNIFLGLDTDIPGRIGFLQKTGITLTDDMLKAAGIKLEKITRNISRKPATDPLPPTSRAIFWPVDQYRSEILQKQAEKAAANPPEKEEGKDNPPDEGEAAPTGDEDLKLDANDLLQAMTARGMAAQAQVIEIDQLISTSPTVVELVCRWAGAINGAAKDQAMRDAFGLIAKMEEFQRAQYRTRLVKALGINIRDFEKILKTVTNNTEESGDENLPIVETLGGYYDGHLLEMIYKPLTKETKLACRWPDGRITVEDRVVIEGTQYVGMAPNALILKDVVLFPSDLPDFPKSLRELVLMIKSFVHLFLDVDDFYENLIAYYTLFTWQYDSFTVLPYLRALGDYGTGKTRLIWVAGICCYRPMFTAGATTTSPIFRMLDTYHGTLILDEADFGRSDEASDIIKILNTGYMKNVPVLRSADSGQGKFEIEAFQVYGPKIIATRKKFADRALESRCLTKEMGGGVPRDDIPIVLPKEYYTTAREIRNHLLLWRMREWVSDRDVDYNSVDRSIESRLNQVTIALKAIIPPEETDMIKEIDDFIRAKNRDLIIERSQTIAAKILEAMLSIYKKQPYATDLEGRPLYDLSFKAIADETNRIIDRENEDEDDGDDEGDSNGPKKYRVGAKKVGTMVSNILQLKSERMTAGPHKGRYYVVWDTNRIEALKRRYGLDQE